MTQSTQRRIPSLRSIALCLSTAFTPVSAAPHPKGGPFRALESVPSGVSLAQIITGLYANDTAEGRIVVQDIHGRESWSWSVADANNQKNIPADLLTCIQTHTAVPEAKWTNGGRSVISIYNAAAIMINHMPGSDQDKQVIWGTCLDRNNMRNTHSLELVPDGKIAIATTSASSDATIKIFNPPPPTPPALLHRRRPSTATATRAAPSQRTRRTPST
ncbi:hypothetical protein NLG97_g9367 [Lecanicillium saksenae]|uniref:Uncharacterized protein n=1 Tax=Lecanicillium saksenae TaxID=468837 RepID=A0ACC1QI81_9HYPO|nr:hypothetical protein NLG97_g9367 [Lecanicillium saksenae]